MEEIAESMTQREEREAIAMRVREEKGLVLFLAIDGVAVVGMVW